jgi:hypothetical protein
MSGEQRGGSRIERILLLLALAGLAAALAIGEFARRRDASETAAATKALSEEIAAVRAEAQAALSAVIAPETVASASASVYLIVVNGSARGTAFVIDRDKGMLATAAHTADSLKLEEGDKVFILNRASHKPIPVKGKRLHAGYGAFRLLVEEYQPIRKNSSIYAPLAAPVRDLAFDAGLITVDPIDSETGQNRLGPNLKIAAEEKLVALAPGSPIAVIGYPYDTLDDGLTPDAAISRVDRGVISAMIAPLDTAADAEDPVVANLIIHRLSTAGGSSGSPVIDAEGDVIGIHTHGIESKSGNADGAAQRADVIYDLLSRSRETSRLADIFQPAWKRRLSYWARADEALPWSFYKEYAEPDEEPPPMVGDIDFSAPAPFVKRISMLTFGEAAREHRVEALDVVAEPLASPETAAPEGTAPAEPAAPQPSSFLIKEQGQFAEAWFEIDRSLETVLFAYDYSLRSRGASCRITAYWRARGDARLNVQRARASFELHFAPSGVGSEGYHVVFRRASGCDAHSAKFMVGEISWEPPAKLAQAPFEGAGPVAEAPASGPVGRFINSAEASLAKVFNCLGRDAEAEQCAEPEFVELETVEQ